MMSAVRILNAMSENLNLFKIRIDDLIEFNRTILSNLTRSLK